MADADLSGAVLDGRYKVIEPIAEGAMGSVYRGERVKLGRAVAIKIMHQELPDELASRQRFEREAKLMALLEHPNCVSVIDFGVHEEKPFLVMDLVRGASLLDLLDKTGPLEVARAGDIIRQVLSGLAHAHELGIVHRDIKPANIMIAEKAGLGPQVRILDFGLARLTETSTKLTTGIVVGTPNYMAPEQCKGGDIDARTDLYACGVMLFEMLTGRKPFVADDPLQVVRKHLLEAPPTLASALPEIDFGDLEAVVARALAKAPTDRFASAVEMSKAVEAAAAKQTKASAAALFARAIPEGAQPPGNQLATMSGWNVPATSGASTSLSAMSASLSAPSMAEPPPVVSPPPLAPPPPPVSPPPAAMPAPPVERAAPAAEMPAAASSPAEMPPPPATPPPATMPSAVTAASAGTDASGTPASVPSAAEPPAAAPPTASLDVASAPHAAAPRLASAPIAPTAGAMSQLPFTKKQLLIGAGAVLALVVLVAVLAGGGSKKRSAGAKPTTKTDSAAVAKPEPLSEVAERARSLIASEDYEDAVAVLRRGRKDHPDSAELAFLAGKAYFGQLWWSDGVDNFRDAIKLDPAYKENPELLKTVLKGFLTTPDLESRIVDFMRHDIGPPMRPYLEETAAKHPKKALRARAAAELNAR